MSFLGKKWRVLNDDSSLSIWQRLLINRGLEAPDQQAKFLDQEGMDFYDPYLLKGMAQTIARLDQAITNQDRIIIFGDYDVDGITSTAMLYLILSELGAQVSYRLPHRIKDGYGLNMRFIDELAEAGANLIITVDCGIACAAEVTKAKELGIEVIITDHHAIPEQIPEDAVAIVHPKQAGCSYPDKELTGAGVAFKIVMALIHKYLPDTEHAERIQQFTDLASMGTVADCAPLVDENRLIVARGLEQLAEASWPGVQALKQVAGIEPSTQMSTYHIGFLLGPRINAVGRIDNPYYALQMMINDYQKAWPLAGYLESVNKQRQELTAQYCEEAEAKIADQLASQKVLIACDPGWHAGVVGLVAGKLAQKYAMPVMLLQEQEDKIVGSCRGPEGFNWAKALADNKKYLEKCGGHKQAAGLSMKKEQLEPFVKAMQQYAIDSKWDQDWEDVLEIDTDLTPAEIDRSFYNQVQRLRPFGVGNRKPVFRLSSQKLYDLRTMGKTGKHFSAKIKGEAGEEFRIIGFNFGGVLADFKEGELVDLACEVDLNSFKGRESLELRLLDISKAG